jgi:hypothetical protein
VVPGMGEVGRSEKGGRITKGQEEVWGNDRSV